MLAYHIRLCGKLLNKDEMTVKDLKLFLDCLPIECNENEVIFGADGLEGMFAVSSAHEGAFEGEVPAGMSKDFVLLWNVGGETGDDFTLHEN